MIQNTQFRRHKYGLKMSRCLVLKIPGLVATEMVPQGPDGG